MADGPEVLNAIDSLIAEDGWKVVAADADAKVYRAEKSGTLDPEVASSTPAGLVQAVRAYEQHLAGTKEDFLPGGSPKTIIRGPLDLEDIT